MKIERLPVEKEIESKDYKRNMEGDGIKKFVFLGIAFRRSEMVLSYDSLNIKVK